MEFSRLSASRAPELTPTHFRGTLFYVEVTMETQNITLSLPKEVLLKVKLIAVQRQTSVSRLLTQPQTWRAAWLSNQALGLGFLLSAAAGVPLGLLLGRSARISAFAELYLNTLLVTPMAPLLPLFILATGLGLTSRVLFIVAFSVVPIIINTQTGIRQVDPGLIDMARSFGAGEMQLWRKVLLPAALPEVLAGLQIALGRAIAGMVVVELLLTAVGFGRLILEAQADFDADVVYALIVIVACEALLLMALVQRLQRRTGTRGTEAWA